LASSGNVWAAHRRGLWQCAEIILFPKSYILGETHQDKDVNNVTLVFKRYGIHHNLLFIFLKTYLRIPNIYWASVKQ
jgi:hypothetical protein